MAKKLKHINHALVAKLHPPQYSMHKYWARKPSNVVAEWISHYSKKGEIILDPFCGSGVALIEGIKQGRRAIGIDLNPIAIFVSRMTAKPLHIQKYKEAFQIVKLSVKEKIDQLYETHCPKCKGVGVIRSVSWDNDKVTKIKYRCPVCEFKKKKNLEKKPSNKDLKKVKKIEKRKVPFWYPKNKLYYPDGKPFKKKEKNECVSDLFTKRNLIALAILHSAINKLDESEIKEFMKFTFSSTVHLASNMTPDTKTKWGAGWTEPSFWVPSRHREYNVWDIFERRVKKIIKGKTHSARNKVVKDYRETSYFEELKKGRANIMFVCKDALDALRGLPKNSIHYIFTDPTYGESIQYGELNYIWASWFRYEKKYLTMMKNDEVVINEEGQRKTFDAYYNMLYTIFKEVGRVLKPGRYMTVTFHNPSFEIRNALERACYVAGFDLENVVYQPPAAIPSSKSSLQPYGSVSGDFYFRFKNVKKSERPLKEDESVFERVVVDATIRIIADRGEPTPMPIISNGIEPALCKHGFPCSRTKTVKKILIEHIGKDFVVLDKGGKEIEKTDKISDKTLWLKKPEKYLLDRLPLKDRIETSIVGLLLRKRKVSFTDIQKELYSVFKNSLTPNPPSIRNVLEEYAASVGGGLWKVKDLVKHQKTQHDRMVNLIAEIGKKAGYKVYADIPEWRRNSRLLPVAKGKLKNVRKIDAIWYNEKIVYVFEVEHTTGITEAIRRGANVPYDVEKCIILPRERANRMRKRINEPFLRKLLDKYRWMFIYYDDLVRLYEKNRRRKSINIAEFRRIIKKVPRAKSKKQKTLHEV